MPSQQFVPALVLTQYTGSNAQEILALFGPSIGGDGVREFVASAHVNDGVLTISWPGNEAWTAPISINTGDWVAKNGMMVISNTDLANGYVSLGSVQNPS